MGNLDTRKRTTTIIRSIEAGVEHIDGISILWICVNSGVVPRTLTQSTFFVDLRPRSSTILRTKDTTVFSFNDRPNAIRISGRDGDAADANRSFRQTRITSDVCPVVATIGRLKYSARWTAALQRPWLSIHFPKTGIENTWICRINDQVTGSGFVASIEHSFPGFATIL